MLLMQSTIPCAPITCVCSQTEQSLRISCRTQTMDDVEVTPAEPHRTPKAGRPHGHPRVTCLSTWSNGLKPCNSCACRSGRWASQGANRRSIAENCRSNKRTGVRRSTHHDMCTKAREPISETQKQRTMTDKTKTILPDFSPSVCSEVLETG